MSVRKVFVKTSLVTVGAIAGVSVVWQPAVWSLVVVGPVVLLGATDMMQKKHAIKRNFPVIGHGRYFLEKIRPEIMQYFVETDTEGTPFNRIFRNLIYQRAKKTNDTIPFGTQMDVYRVGYEWLAHSMYINQSVTHSNLLRVMVGGRHCTKPYSSSILNVSAMSYGSLSKNAVLAINKGAKAGNFSQNTGEGSISPHHLEHGGDLVWQIGTGYFGCRTEEGDFYPEAFKKNATRDSVKMIEIKISQGAKPGHGGILPGNKNTPEIAAIRGVEPGVTVHSPPSHSMFSNPAELLTFVQQLRELSGGKPVGFKLCIGIKEQFIALCAEMVASGISPDFITIDGGEGGTGAAPVEFSNSLGMPLRDALSFASDTLIGFDLKKEIKVIATGKITSGFHIVRALALGADMVNSARGMMMAIGCIQALHCNKNSCPVGVATQDPSLMKGLNVTDKSVRISQFHHLTLESFNDLISAAGIPGHTKLHRHHINRRVSATAVMNYEEIYPSTELGALLP
ncbi:MAG: FMN-binding glutamate synthase family protein [Fibrobacterales bacterium]